MMSSTQGVDNSAVDGPASKRLHNMPKLLSPPSLAARIQELCFCSLKFQRSQLENTRTTPIRKSSWKPMHQLRHHPSIADPGNAVSKVLARWRKRSWEETTRQEASDV